MNNVQKRIILETSSQLNSHALGYLETGVPLCVHPITDKLVPLEFARLSVNLASNTKNDHYRFYIGIFLELDRFLLLFELLWKETKFVSIEVVSYDFSMRAPRIRKRTEENDFVILRTLDFRRSPPRIPQKRFLLCFSNRITLWIDLFTF